jgi:hypothetical protein
MRARLEKLGCEVKDLSGEMVTETGARHVLYAFNPANRRFVVLPIMDGDGQLSPWHVGNIERRLGVKTGFPRL